MEYVLILGLIAGSLNALSGIGGVQTQFMASASDGASEVLMPCRALEAFRQKGQAAIVVVLLRLNALSGIGGVQTLPRPAPGGRGQ